MSRIASWIEKYIPEDFSEHDRALIRDVQTQIETLYNLGANEINSLDELLEKAVEPCEKAMSFFLVQISEVIQQSHGNGMSNTLVTNTIQTFIESIDQLEKLDDDECNPRPQIFASTLALIGIMSSVVFTKKMIDSEYRDAKDVAFGASIQIHTPEGE